MACNQLVLKLEPQEEICEESIAELDALLDPEKDVFGCSQCDLTSTTDQLFQEHTRKKHEVSVSPGGEKPFEMAGNQLVLKLEPQEEITEESISELDALLVPEEKDLFSCSGRKDLLVCPHCNKTFNRAGKLENHIRTHTGEKPFVCNVCQKGFCEKSKLKRHKLIHPGERHNTSAIKAEGGCNFRCPMCDYVAKSNSDSKKHERSVHKREGRNHVCPHCSKTFDRAGKLENHIRTHTGQKPFVCKVCAKRFNLKRNLEQHQLIHSGEHLSHLHANSVPFACKECGQSFSLQHHLKTHQRIHTGEKPYKCKWCDKRFNQSSALTAHERTHTGEKPYQCKMCSYRCTTSSSLRRHECKVHNMWE